MDDFGVLVLLDLKKRLQKRHRSFRIAEASDEVRNMLLLLDFESLGGKPPVPGGKEPRSVAEAMSRAASKISHCLITDIRMALSAEP
jgi:hypothetical protein